MRYKRFYIIGLLSFFFLGTLVSSYAQKSLEAKIDSLKRQLTTGIQDSIEIVIYYEIAQSYTDLNGDSLLFYSKIVFNKVDNPTHNSLYNHLRGLIAYNNANFDSAIFFYDIALESFLKEKNIKKIAEVYNDIGVSHDFKSEYPEALNSYFKSLNYYEQIEYNIGIANVYNNIGIIFKILGEYDSASTYYFKSAELKAELNDKNGISLMYHNIADLKILLKEYDEALEFLHKSIEINKQTGYDLLLSYNYANLGVVKFHKGDYKGAEENYERALELYNSFGDVNGVSDILIYQGQLSVELKKYEEALSYFNNSLKVKNQIGSKLGEAQILIYMANCLEEYGKINEAISKAQKGLSIAKSIEAKHEVRVASEFLYNAFYKLGDYDSAYGHLNTFDSYTDSLFNENNTLDVSRVKSKYILNQAQRENEILQKEHALQTIAIEQNKLQLQNQNTILIALFICLLFALTASIFWYLYTQKKHKTIFLLRDFNDEINQKKEQIELQAKKLQRANLDIKKMNEKLEDLVKEKTEKIQLQNTKLKDYAFGNSHEVKEPLAKLLTLVTSSKGQEMSLDEKLDNIKKIKDPVEKLDKIIKKLNDVLEEERI